MFGIVVVNHNTAELTVECLRSIRASDTTGLAQVIAMDSGSELDQRAILRKAKTWLDLPLAVRELGRNVGFAAACNLGIDELLADPEVSHVLLLNNDAVLETDGLAGLLDFVEAHPEAGMVAGRMHRFDDPDAVDSLGIALYASALASNRMTTEDRLLGPTGGLAIYSRVLLEAVIVAHGSVFDEDFFCYAEDTDLALRALLLGFQPAYFDQRAALHHGQASSGGGFSDFVLYHGIRNSIWTAIKNLPGIMLLLMSPLILALHVGIVLRHSVRGKGNVVWRLYRDAIRGLPAAWRKRRTIQRSRLLGTRALWRHVTPRFYDRDYLRNAWRDLWR